MTEQIQTDWVAWFEKDENGIITRAGVDNDNSAEQYNVCVTTSLDGIDSSIQTLQIADPEVYNRVVIQDTNLIAAAPKLLAAAKRTLTQLELILEMDDPQACTQMEWEAEPLSDLRAAIIEAESGPV